MTRIALTCCIAWLVVFPADLRAQEWDLGEYADQLGEKQTAPDATQSRSRPEASEPVADSHQTPSSTPPAPIPAAKQSALHRDTTKETGATDFVRQKPEPKTTDEVDESPDSEEAEPATIIRFGVGGSWYHVMRLADDASNDRLMTEISFSWAPFADRGEVGMDLLLARDKKFVVRPNLKFFFFKHYWFSIFMEGACDVLFLADSTEVGGGGGLGVVIGLMDTLTLELKGSATIYTLSPEGTLAMFGAAELEPDSGGSPWTVVPAATARLMARF